VNKSVTTAPISVNYLGTDNYRWTVIYSASALNTSSDRRLKNHVEYVSDDIDNLKDFYLSLKPCAYTRLGNTKPEFGLYAQDVLESIWKYGYNGYGMVEQGSDGYYSLYYEHINSLTIGIVQDTVKRTDENEKELTELKEYVKLLEDRIATLESVENVDKNETTV
jgi:hypothetical protein